MVKYAEGVATMAGSAIDLPALSRALVKTGLKIKSRHSLQSPLLRSAMPVHTVLLKRPTGAVKVQTFSSAGLAQG